MGLSALLVLILRALNPGDILGVGVESSLAEEGHETLQDVVVAPGPGGLVMTAGEDVIPVDIVGRGNALRPTPASFCSVFLSGISVKMCSK